MSFKTVIIGDGAVGKTSLLVVFKDGKFPEEYIPTIFDNYHKEVSYQDESYTLQLWDTAGQEEFIKLRRMSYPDTDCFVICFSVVDRVSFENIPEKWYKDLVDHNVDDAAIILVGTKVDLRNNEKFCRELVENRGDEYKPVTASEGKGLAKKIGGWKYIECSAKTKENVRNVFEEIVRYLASGGRNKNKKKSKKKRNVLSLSCGGSLKNDLANIPLPIETETPTGDD